MLKNNLEAMMKQKKVSSKQLSEATGISRTSISKLINQNDRLKRYETNTIESICNYFNVGVGDFLTIVEKPQYDFHVGILKIESFHQIIANPDFSNIGTNLPLIFDDTSVEYEMNTQLKISTNNMEIVFTTPIQFQGDINKNGELENITVSIEDDDIRERIDKIFSNSEKIYIDMSLQRFFIFEEWQSVMKNEKNTPKITDLLSDDINNYFM